MLNFYTPGSKQTKLFNRLFVFGCSFTMYKWPTWADYFFASGIAEEYHNWALPGGSNDFIFHSFMECDISETIDKNDFVAIMWSQMHRLSDYTHDTGWKLPGNAYMYQPKQRMKYYCPDKAEIELESYIHGIRETLKGRECKYLMMSVEKLPGIHTSMAKYLGYNTEHDFWRETLPGDRHPSPREHCDFAKEQLIKLKRRAKVDVDLDTTDRLKQAAEDHIWKSPHPHRQQAVVFPEKYPIRRGGMDVSGVQFLDWE